MDLRKSAFLAATAVALNFAFSCALTILVYVRHEGIFATGSLVSWPLFMSPVVAQFVFFVAFGNAAYAPAFSGTLKVVAMAAAVVTGVIGAHQLFVNWTRMPPQHAFNLIRQWYVLSYTAVHLAARVSFFCFVAANAAALRCRAVRWSAAVVSVISLIRCSEGVFWMTQSVGEACTRGWAFEWSHGVPLAFLNMTVTPAVAVFGMVASTIFYFVVWLEKDTATRAEPWSTLKA